MRKFFRVSGHAAAALGISLLGVALSPAVLGILPPKAALAVSLAGAVYQASTGKTIKVDEAEPADTTPTQAK